MAFLKDNLSPQLDNAVITPSYIVIEADVNRMSRSVDNAQELVTLFSDVAKANGGVVTMRIGDLLWEAMTSAVHSLDKSRNLLRLDYFSEVKKH